MVVIDAYKDNEEVKGIVNQAAIAVFNRQRGNELNKVTNRDEKAGLYRQIAKRIETRANNLIGNKPVRIDRLTVECECFP